MARSDRGGVVLKTGRIGRLNILRQQVLLPGEVITPSIVGSVDVTPMRETDSTFINARLDAFLMPIRWLDSSFTDYVNQGGTKPFGTVSCYPGALGLPDYGSDNYVNPTLAFSGISGVPSGGFSSYPAQTLPKVFANSVVKVYNNWWRWPEDSEVAQSDVISTSNRDGMAVQNLPIWWTRLHKDEPDVTEAPLVGTSPNQKVSMKNMRNYQAHYQTNLVEDWLGHGRYLDQMRALWRSKGSREVDQVPMKVGSTTLNVSPYELKATDSEGLGASATFHDFRVGHNFGPISMPEHAILVYTLCVRFLPIAEREQCPVATMWRNKGDFDREDLLGIPVELARQTPRPVLHKMIKADTASGSTIVGWMPAGWHWRAGWNCVDQRIDARGTWPLYSGLEQSDGKTDTAKELRDATQFNPAFVSESYGDYTCRLRFSEPSRSPIPGAMSGITGGSGSDLEAGAAQRVS